ncbi:LPD1 domain-containing protein [Aneurinibacillus migulanus]|uniref:LPD1 domain-containing protein n=1 Tax=Aneurinibacillus migulanus TaxID=47500 RepID=UPI0020A0A536|nr:LPD1 domain-containing protein [Aneurinibacillus migulanus]MCP1359302.1 hypothetical protein [Aneurinibacillus migulanus]
MAGEAVEMIENTNTGSTAYCVPRAWKSTYLSTNKDVGKTMRILCYGEKSSLRSDIERLKSKYIDNPQRLEQEIKKRNTKHKKELNRIAHIIAYIHYKETNEFLKEIPVSRGHSYFYMDARKRDASRSKPYWSTSYELCVRAFEAYIQDKLQDSGRNNDYLVCGTRPGTKNKGRTLAERCMPPFDYPYPLDEERVRINHAFDKFFETLRGNFFTCEMDSYSTGLEDRKKQCMIVPSTTVCFNQEVQFHFDDAGQGVLFL